jgi:hypothetical protein
MSLTPKQFADQLRGKLAELQKNNRPFQLAVLSSVAQVAKRAFSDGVNNVGQSFSYNDSDPLYISDDQSPRKLSHKGKTGQNVFKSTGKPHKTTYFDSYKSFRANVGRRTSTVNWQLNGDLMSDFGSIPAPVSKQPPSLSQMRPAVKISPNFYITKLDRDINVKKYSGLSERYGEFLKVSASEEKEFFRIFDNELILFLSK